MKCLVEKGKLSTCAFTVNYNFVSLPNYIPRIFDNLHNVVTNIPLG